MTLDCHERANTPRSWLTWASSCTSRARSIAVAKACTAQLVHCPGRLFFCVRKASGTFCLPQGALGWLPIKTCSLDYVARLDYDLKQNRILGL